MRTGVCLESVLEKHLKEMAAGQGAALRQWILSLVASPQHRVEGAQRAADYVAEHLRALSQQGGRIDAAAARRRSAASKQTLLQRKGRQPPVAAVPRLRLAASTCRRSAAVAVFPPADRRIDAQWRLPADRADLGPGGRRSTTSCGTWRPI